jgi:hypothetical protein
MKFNQPGWSTVLAGFLVFSGVAALATETSLAPQPVPADLRSAVALSARVGRLLYMLDKAAAMASDELLYHERASEDHVPTSGFLAMRDVDATGAEKGSFTVIFYSPGSEPKVAYRVHLPFKQGTAVSVEEVKPPSSPGVEVETMIRARTTALAALHGATQPMNPVVLPARPLIGEDGFLVYLLAGTKRPGIAVFGKHYRVLVSPDGTTVKRFEPLSRSALEMPLGPPKPGSTTAALVVSQIVTDYPLETHVLVSLLNRVPIVVATRRGAWRVEGDHIDFLGQVPAAASAPSSSGAGQANSFPACKDLCASALAAHCPSGPRDQNDCLGPCQRLQAGSCADSFQAFIDCSGPAPSFTCDAHGFITSRGCESQYLAALRCGSARMRDPASQ